MKILILTISAYLIILAPNVVLGEVIVDLVQREGTHYKKFSDIPFSGKVTEEEQGTFKNGIKA